MRAALSRAVATVALPVEPSLHKQLRGATTAAHVALEDALDLLRPPLERERFVRLLRRWHAFHAAWQPALGTQLPRAITAPRDRLGALASDLHALGCELAKIDRIAAHAPAAALCETRAAALGSLYVIEGSTLGGRVVAGALAAAPWLPPGGLRSFDPYGADCATRWRETLGFIAHADEPPRWIVDSALRTFELLREWLPAPARRLQTDARFDPPAAPSVADKLSP